MNLPLTNRRSRHIPELDSIRGLAILLVVTFHSGLLINGSTSSEKAWLNVVSIGWAGVDLFFVLSGYLITKILIQSRETPNFFRNFFARRVLRIFPLYFGSLAILIACGLATHDQRWTYWLFLQNWIPIVGGPPQPVTMQPYWSLAVEEQFYLVWPLIIYFLKPKQIGAFCIATIVFSCTLRCLAKTSGVDPWAITITTPFRMDALAFGGLISWIELFFNPAQLRKAGTNLLLAGFAGVLTIGITESGYRMDGWWAQTIGYTFFAAMCSGLIAIIVSAKDGLTSWAILPLQSKVLQHLGNRSYAIYVTHMPFLVVMTVLYKQRLAIKDTSGTRDVQCFFLAMIGCLITAEVSWHLFEKQFLKLKRYFPNEPHD